MLLKRFPLHKRYAHTIQFNQHLKYQQQSPDPIHSSVDQMEWGLNEAQLIITICDVYICNSAAQIFHHLRFNHACRCFSHCKVALEATRSSISHEKCE